MPTAPTHGFVQIPPDSTGKHLTHSVMHEVTIVLTGVNEPNVGERCSFATSLLQGTISKVDPAGGVGAFELHVSLTDPIPNNVTSIVGEAFLENGVAIGTVDAVGELFYYPQNVIVGGTNNINQMEINNDGAAWVTFPEGAPNFDSFGKMQVSQQHTLSSYVHTYDTLDDRFTTELVGSGAYSHLPNVSGVLLSCGTDSGAKVCRTSDEYLIYQPGVSQLLMFTGAVGDNGKTNVVRRLGLYDDDNGLFFELYETTFNLVIRSKSTGTVVERRFPSSEWNHDRMDGSGGVFNPSGIQLSPSMDNVYWIDYQWLGAGTVRFGVYVDGKRVLLHAAHHTNSTPHSYMTTGSLPFRYEQYNIGPAASTSEMRVFCASVKTEGEFQPRRTLNSTMAQASVTTSSPTFITSIRPTQYVNGVVNRSVAYMYSITAYNHSDDPMLVEIRRGALASGGTWTLVTPNSVIEENNTATSMAGGAQSWMMIVPPKERVCVDVRAYDEARQGFRRKYDSSLATEQVVSARLLSGATGGLVTVTLQWDEVRN